MRCIRILGQDCIHMLKAAWRVARLPRHLYPAFGADATGGWCPFVWVVAPVVSGQLATLRGGWCLSWLRAGLVYSRPRAGLPFTVLDSTAFRCLGLVCSQPRTGLPFTVLGWLSPSAPHHLARGPGSTAVTLCNVHATDTTHIPPGGSCQASCDLSNSHSSPAHLPCAFCRSQYPPPAAVASPPPSPPRPPRPPPPAPPPPPDPSTVSMHRYWLVLHGNLYLVCSQCGGTRSTHPPLTHRPTPPLQADMPPLQWVHSKEHTWAATPAQRCLLCWGHMCNSPTHPHPHPSRCCSGYTRRTICGPPCTTRT